MMPKVSIVVTAFWPNAKQYLDACMRSIELLDYPKECLDVIIVSPKSYAPKYFGARTISPATEEYFNPEALNLGIRAAHPDSKYFFILNDDVILARSSLKRMVEAAGNAPLVLNPISQCENGLTYRLNMSFNTTMDGQEVTAHLTKFSYKYEELEQLIPDLIKAEPFYPPGIVSQAFLCMFATLIPRIVWDKVGEFDEKFKTGQDDIDYSRRCQMAGASLGISLDSIVWHFGGASSSKTINNKLRAENVKHFKEKWGCLPPYVTEKSYREMQDNTLAEFQ